MKADTVLQHGFISAQPLKQNGALGYVWEGRYLFLAVSFAASRARLDIREVAHQLQDDPHFLGERFTQKGGVYTRWFVFDFTR
jgi:hypothetical protein